MAVRLLTKTRVVFVYNSNLRSIAQGLQAFSSSAGWGSGRNLTGLKEEQLTTESVEPTVWPDPNLGILGPNDKRLTLPGNVGFSLQVKSSFNLRQPKTVKKVLKDEDNILICQLPDERQRMAVNQAFNQNDMDDFMDPGIAEDLPPASAVLECVAQECPKLLQKDFSDLFPSMNLTSGPFTVITMCQKTKHDMSAWSEMVEMEREELMLYFVMAAEEICNQLKAKGFWADFIDPASGRAHLGDYTSATFFETDERYRHLGFRIEDLGCCKVITHHKWQSNIFVGCLFTNAPTDGLHIKSIIDKHNNPVQK